MRLNFCCRAFAASWLRTKVPVETVNISGLIKVPGSPVVQQSDTMTTTQTQHKHSAWKPTFQAQKRLKGIFQTMLGLMLLIGPFFNCQQPIECDPPREKEKKKTITKCVSVLRCHTATTYTNTMCPSTMFNQLDTICPRMARFLGVLKI